ncbi:hypothetical protein E5676_scaffold352G003190 [Cucumis melo var. makuwa]|uniref:Uncharacterized protein n=1 Tax=Cucumis melo var. makuwa TaxID=1194695 RepID=A0A5A7TRW0_CUCMM|nr:hypothetical protein E6C27_scaffold236G002920 [Cucumis melo var. makuwa]TYK25192.1 hypothetical protein E5676_scaffold352G003190 [Cucumis melo var. makuwa]
MYVMEGGDGIWWLRNNYDRWIELTEMAKFGAYAAFGSSLRLYVGTSFDLDVES